MRAFTRLALLAAAAMGLAAGCGGSSSSSPSTPTTPTTPIPPTTPNRAIGFFITISGMAFSPLNLDVPPGATVTVVNQDSVAHTVTSETHALAFVPGAVNGVSFDTDLFTGTKTFTIPANAAEGTVIPYYCKNHLNLMATPTGSITIRARA